MNASPTVECSPEGGSETLGTKAVIANNPQANDVAFKGTHSTLDVLLGSNDCWKQQIQTIRWRMDSCREEQ